MNHKDVAELEMWRSFARGIEPDSPVKIRDIKRRIGERYLIIEERKHLEAAELIRGKYKPLKELRQWKLMVALLISREENNEISYTDKELLALPANPQLVRFDRDPLSRSHFIRLVPQLVGK